MRSSAPSPGPMDDGRFELGSTEAGADPLAALLGVTLAGADADGDGVAPLEQAATKIPRLAAAASSVRDLMLLLLQVLRSRRCAVVSRSGGRPCHSGPRRPSTTSRGSAE